MKLKESSVRVDFNKSWRNAFVTTCYRIIFYIIFSFLVFVFCFFSFLRISGNFLLLLALVAMATSATSAFKQQHPAIRTGHRSGFRRSSWVVAAASENDDAASQGHDDTSRAIHGKLNTCINSRYNNQPNRGRDFWSIGQSKKKKKKKTSFGPKIGIPEAYFHASYRKPSKCGLTVPGIDNYHVKKQKQKNVENRRKNIIK